jgi:hypothetical protein
MRIRSRLILPFLIILMRLCNFSLQIWAALLSYLLRNCAILHSRWLTDFHVFNLLDLPTAAESDFRSSVEYYPLCSTSLWVEVAHQCSVWLRARLPGERGSIPGRGQRDFPLVSVFKPALGPMQTPVQWALESFPRGLSADGELCRKLSPI